MKNLLLCAIFLLSFCASTALTIKGQIVDAGNNEPVPGVTVIIENINVFLQTDDQGRFQIIDLIPGKHEIIFKRIGFRESGLTRYFTESVDLMITLEKQLQLIEGIKVSETRARERETPVTFSNINNEEIRENNYGQDIPILLNELPNVFSYSDAGNGFGYTNLKVRGFDQQRIGVMINGIPLNDPEDHQVYWVDMPDFAESISDIQFQRGVGSSLYGISTFGGALNMETSTINQRPGLELYGLYGSYNSYKAGIKITRDVGAYFKTSLRFSRLESDGYRDNSASDLLSFYFNLSHISDRSIMDVNVYGGKEITHAAWYASPESALEENHQHNPITYPDELDNFSQPHYEIHNRFLIGEGVDLKNTLFYIRGNGYYKQFKTDRDLWEYGLAEGEEELYSDMVRKKQVRKNHYGWIGQLTWDHERGELTIGSYLSLFDSDHRGEVEWLELEVPEFEPGFEYYHYTGNKRYITLYLNEEYRIFENLNLMTSLYFQNIRYEFAQQEAGNFSGAYLNSYTVDYDFFNPRTGVNWNINDEINIYGNVSLASREPADGELYDTWDGPDDLGVQPLFSESETVYNDDGSIERIFWSDPLVKEEKLVDYELGINYLTSVLDLRLNLFWMDFQDEIIAYGGVDDDGYPIRGNADETVHRGIEFSFSKMLPANLYLNGNVSYNDNYFRDFIMYDYDEDWNVTEVDFSGNRIAGFPDIVTGVKLKYQQEAVMTSLQWQYAGKQYLDNTQNEERIIDPFNIFNLNFIYKLKDLFFTKNLEFTVRVNNIFDKKYVTAGYMDWVEEDGDWMLENHYWPAAGRNIYAGIRCNI